MTEKLLNCISQKLDYVFNDIPIYFNSIKQGFNVPCFFVKSVKNQEIKMLSRRFKLINQIEISYFSKNNLDTVEDNIKIADVLLNELRIISFDKGFIRGENLHYFIDDDKVLKFYVNYDFYVFKPDESNFMTRLFK